VALQRFLAECDNIWRVSRPQETGRRRSD